MVMIFLHSHCHHEESLIAGVICSHSIGREHILLPLIYDQAKYGGMEFHLHFIAYLSLGGLSKTLNNQFICQGLRSLNGDVVEKIGFSNFTGTR